MENFIIKASELEEPQNKLRENQGLISVFDIYGKTYKTQVLPHGRYLVVSGVDDGFAELYKNNSYVVMYSGCGLIRDDDDSIQHGAKCPLWLSVKKLEK